MKKKSETISVIVILASFFFGMPVAADEGNNRRSKDRSIERGAYLTTILGCGGCHTEGALERLPYGSPLAGSQIGIAYTNEMANEHPAIVFPSNLTPHKEHGLGNWSKRQIARAIRSGINHSGGEVVSVMPWMNYSLLTSRDTYDIVNYLKSVKAIDYQIPTNIVEGEQAEHDYLRIGVFLFVPSQSVNPVARDGQRIEYPKELDKGYEREE